MSGRRPRRSGDSVQKKQKERYKRERREQKMSGKPSGQPANVSEIQRILRKAKPDSKKRIVQLKPVSSGWVPRITVGVLAKLKKLESTSLGQYSYIVNRSRSTIGKTVVFEVSTGLDMSSKRGKFIGDFQIDLERKTIRKTKRRY